MVNHLYIVLCIVAILLGITIFIISNKIIGIIFFIIGVSILVYISTLKNKYNRTKDVDIIQTAYKTDNTVGSENNQKIIVWTYWEGDESNLVNMCLNNIKKSCDSSSSTQYTYEHKHLNKGNINRYININNHICAETKEHLRSDIIRLSLLFKYGGIWLDASVFLIKPINYIFFSDGKPPAYSEYLFGVYNSLNNTNNKYPVIETSAICCNNGNKLIKQWLDEISNIDDCSEQGRKHYATKYKLTNLKNLIPQYHYVYYCLQKVLKENNGITSYNGVYIMDAITGNYFCYINFDKEDFIYMSLSNFSKKYNLEKCQMIKFIRSEREYIDKMWDKINSTGVLKSFSTGNVRDQKKYMDNNKDVMYWAPSDLQKNTPNLSKSDAETFFPSDSTGLNGGWWLSTGINSSTKRMSCAIFASQLIKPRNFLEIGFNAGHSLNAILFHNPSIKFVLEFGLGECPKCLEHTQKRFPDVEIQYVKGYSRDTVPTIPTDEKFDLIHIDGSHEEDDVIKDIINCKKLASPSTVLILDDCGGEMNKDQCCKQVCNAIETVINKGIISVIPGCNEGSIIARYNF